MGYTLHDERGKHMLNIFVCMFTYKKKGTGPYFFFFLCVYRRSIVALLCGSKPNSTVVLEFNVAVVA